MEKEHFLEILMNNLREDSDIGKHFEWIKNPDNENEAFVLLNDGSGGTIFIVNITNGKIQVTD